MSVVISVRVKKEIKELLESEGINIAEEVRRFLEELAYKVRIRKYVEKWDKMLEGVTPSPHPWEALRLPRAVCRFSARTRTPHLPFGFPILGASLFRAGGPRLQRVPRSSLPTLAPLHPTCRRPNLKFVSLIKFIRFA